VPSVLAEMITGRGPDEDEPLEDKLLWAAKTSALYPFMTVVGLRDIMNAMGSDYGYSITPVADAFGSIVDTSKEISAGNFGKSLARDAALAVGYWGHLPTRQAWLTGEYLYDWASGNTDGFSPFEALVRRDR